MAELPIIWRVNRRPRFTLLDMGEYMASDDGPRETIRRNMKYEKVAPTILYSELYRAIAGYLCSPARSLKTLYEFGENLKNRLESETNPQVSNNITYVLRSLETFIGSLNELGISGVGLHRPPTFEPLMISGVRISAMPTALIKIPRARGGDLIGAINIDMAKGVEPKTEEAKLKATNGMTHAAMLLHQHVAAICDDGQKASPEHCIVFHTHRKERIVAPANYRRSFRNIEAVCRDIDRAWPTIEPPPTFDPSRARFRS